MTNVIEIDSLVLIVSSIVYSNSYKYENIDQELFSNKCSKEQLLELINKLHSNKFSSELLLSIHNLDEPQLMNMVAQDKNKKVQRIKGLRFLSKVLNGVNYLIMKDLRVPYSLLSDIDVLLSDYIELLKAVKLLEREGCKAYSFRLLAHPFKVMLKDCSESSFEIDLYPHPMWIRRQVASNEEVFQVKTFLEAYDTKIPVPSPSMDFYLVATHAWSHLKLSLAEALHLLQVSKNLRESEWFYIMKVAEEWGTLDSIYVTSLILNALSSSLYGYQVVPEDIMNELERLYKASNGAKKWLKSMQRLEFPVRFPVHLAVLNSSIYTFQALWKKSLRTAIYGVLSIYLNYSAGKLLGGEND